ncbi:unnamed protein product [Auanema sp. JU1783]|nr:unnamed protein product [Auanema sp. JU1783]
MGNCIVIWTILHDNRLRQQHQYWIVASLAIADLSVGLIVMPMTLIYEIWKKWVLGLVLCEIWLALDVLFVTSSNLHICAIAIHRFVSMKFPVKYASLPHNKVTTITIILAWLLSLIISLPPLIGWRHQQRNQECVISSDLGYVLYSASGSFYIPITIILFVYWRIHKITDEYSRRRLRESYRCSKVLEQSQSLSGDSDNVLQQRRETIHKKLRNKERQATFLIGLILIGFIALWLPFFTLYVIGGFGYSLPDEVFQPIFWLGYFNSGVNPIIYAVFSPDFKQAFNREFKHFITL